MKWTARILLASALLLTACSDDQPAAEDTGSDMAVDVELDAPPDVDAGDTGVDPAPDVVEMGGDDSDADTDTGLPPFDITGEWWLLRYHFTDEPSQVPGRSELERIRFVQEGNTFTEYFGPDDDVGLDGTIVDGVYIQTDGTFRTELEFSDVDHGTGFFEVGELTVQFDFVRVGAAEFDVAGDWLADDGTGTSDPVTVELDGDELTVDIGEQSFRGRLARDSGLLLGAPQPTDGALSANIRWSGDDDAVATLYESSWTPSGGGHTGYTADETTLTLSRAPEGCDGDGECGVTQRCVERECVERVDGDPCDSDDACPGALYCAGDACQDGSSGDPCDETADCAVATDLCDVTCRPREAGEACGTGDVCPGALYCADALCRAGETGDPCTETADCADPTDLCDTTCRARQAGEACGTGDVCPETLYCAADVICYGGAEGDPCAVDTECELAGNYCGPDGACYDGSTGDPCDETPDCAAPADVCFGEPAVCTGPFCGNGACDDGESWNLCPGDCTDVCGDGVCDATEQLVSAGDDAFCAADCRVTVIFELDATSNPPGEGEGAWIAGNVPAFGEWTPNTIPLLDDGVAPDLAAGDNVFTAAFVFDPGTALEYKYTIGASGAGWEGTEEYAGGNNRGYLVPSDGVRRVRIRDLWSEQPAANATSSASSRLTIEDAACVFDEGCDRLRETDASCPSECPGPAGSVYVPPGVFQMGSPELELGRGDTEDLHEVTLTRGFLMDATEVTQEDWVTRMGVNPSELSDCGGDCPVERVTWSEALAYANARSVADGLPACYELTCGGTIGEDFSCGAPTITAPDGDLYDCEGWRLPTEAEWEYAYRAGHAAPFYNGPITELGCEPIDPVLDEIGWYCGNAEETHPVGQKVPNARGLYDMSGNVWEWVWDLVGDYPGDVTDPTGPTEGTSTRMGRGGAWSLEPVHERAAARSWFTGPDARLSFRGLRLVRTAPFFCSSEGGCRIEGFACETEADCPDGLYCASSEGLCFNGSTGDACGTSEQCTDVDDICDGACRDRADGEACGEGDACPVGLYCESTEGLCRVTPPYDVCSSGCPFSSIQAAIDAASEGDTIELGPETFTEPNITISAALRLVGQGASSTIVEAAASVDEATERVFNVPEGVDVELEGLTVRHGNGGASPGGGGIYNQGTLTLRRCVVADNSGGDGPNPGVDGGDGGGILSTGAAATLTLEDCTVRNNRAGDGASNPGDWGGDGGLGGGIRVDGGTVTVVRSTVVGNVAGRGGDGCDSFDGEVTPFGGLGGEGGGMALESATALVLNSTFVANEAGPGGAGHPTACPGGPTSGGNGGGILSARTDLDIAHSTFTGNASLGDYGGGGVSIFFGASRVRNSVFAENTSTNANDDCFVFAGSTTVTSLGYNLLQTQAGCNVISEATDDIVGVAPQLADLADNGGPTPTRLPSLDSPLVDAVPTASCVDFGGQPVAVDQRGATRPFDAACDIGAVERAPALPLSVTDWYALSGYFSEAPGADLWETAFDSQAPGSCPSRAGEARGDCMRVTYNRDPDNNGAGPAYSGWFWQYPGGNWGDEPGLPIPPGATEVSFYAWGAAGGERVDFKAGILAADGFEIPSGIQTLTTTPTRYTIDLSESGYTDVAGGFAWIMEADVAPLDNTAWTFYVDDVVYR